MQTKRDIMSNDHYFCLLGCSTVRMFQEPSQALRKGFSTPFLPSPLLPASSYSLKDLTLLKCVNSSNFFNSWKFQGKKMNPKQNSRCSRHRLLSSLPCETKWQRHILETITFPKRQKYIVHPVRNTKQKLQIAKYR